MGQNRNQLIDLFVGNISNAVVHEILEKSIDVEEIVSKYNKEIKASFDVAKYYRDKINPIDRILPFKDAIEIKKKIFNKVRSELQFRISKGYKNIDIYSAEKAIDGFLKKLNVI